jgi:hypothetical protein
MANLETSLPFATYKDELKDYLEIAIADASEDTSLEGWWNSAVRYGDLWLAQPFVDSLGADLPIPLGVIMGVKEWVRMARAWKRSGVTPGVTQTKTDNLTLSFGNVGDGSMPIAAITNAAKPHWRPSRKKIWR